MRIGWSTAEVLNGRICAKQLTQTYILSSGHCIAVPPPRLTMLRGLVNVLYAVFFISIPQTHGIAVVNSDCEAETFAFCPAYNDLESYEFQLRLNMDPFAGASTTTILRERANLLMDAFVESTDGDVHPKKSFEEEIFTEASWFLTQQDGSPLPTDTATDVPYTVNSYIRRRDRQEFEDEELEDEVKSSASLKIRGVDPTTFAEPDKDNFKASVDCDVYEDLSRATYKAKIKKIPFYVKFNTFGDVLERFSFAGSVFQLDSATRLPHRDAYTTHRFKWKDVKFHGVEIECSLDLRFRDAGDAVVGYSPYAGEFSCSIDTDDVKDEDKDVGEMLEKLRDVFREFNGNATWVQSIGEIEAA